MPPIEENRLKWDEIYKWPQDGDEWSREWGTADDQWHAVIYPRIRPFLPAATILEIGCGHGRWTRFLRPHCDRLIGVDLSPRGIERCRERFADDSGAEFHANDGLSLKAVPDRSVDFAFSFDALVHVERDVVESYLKQFPAKFRSCGSVAFLHHSNAGVYAVESDPYCRRVIEQKWRSLSVSAELVAEYCRRFGLIAAYRETINWENDRWLIDCFTVVAPADGGWAYPADPIENPHFRDESRRVRALSRLRRAYEQAAGR